MKHPSPRTSTAAVTLGAALLALASTVTAPDAVATPRPFGSIAPSTRFYADPGSAVMRWVAQNPNDPREPAIASRIASQPQGIWFATFSPSTVTTDVRRVTGAAAAANQVPVLVVYEIPNRDCGGASAGGAPDITSYDDWIQRFSQGLGTGPVVVILEPDSLALQSCLNAQQVTARDNALALAGQTIHQADPNAKVYLDSGHSNWNSPADQAARLNAAQVRTSADGIYTNVSNFRTTGDELTFTRAILAALGNPPNLHIVVDTSRNGNGPAPGDPFCDPPGRALGTNPTADTGAADVDAFLWVKPPGEADGCIAAPGTFVPDYAFGLTGSTAPTPPPGGGTGGGGTVACQVSYANQSEWVGGFVANLTITNTGTSAIGGWSLSFAFGGDQRVTNFWNSTVTQSGATVRATDAGFNASIPAGGSTTMGFQGTWVTSDAAPTGFALNGTTCTR